MVNNSVFLALCTKELRTINIRSLTPLVMHWSENIWLFNLSPCYSYWHAHSKSSGQTIHEILQGLIQRYLTDKMYYASLAPHPWQAILLNNLMVERHLHGFVSHSSPFGRSLYNQLTWDAWWEAAQQISKNLALIYNQTDIDSFQKNLRRMTKSIERLRIKTPKSFSEVGTNGIRRRYGYIIGLLWEWYLFTPEHTWLDELDSFPFHNIENHENPRCQRVMDYSIDKWEQIEPLLKQDFNKLCHHKSYAKGFFVLSLEWKLTLQDLRTFTVPITFRHPHDLRKHFPEQRPALLQAYYNFSKVSEEAFTSYLEIDMQPPPVSSWSIKVIDAMTSTYQANHIFDEDYKDQETLQSIDNQLQYPLNSYYMGENWTPEDCLYLEPPHEALTNTNHKNSMLLANRNRPLFIMKDIEPLEQSPATSSLWQFQERIMSKWWQSAASFGQRDYYILVNHKKQHLWVFKDQNNKWFLHGIFG